MEEEGGSKGKGGGAVERELESGAESGWGGGWGFSPLSYLSDLQKEITRNASAVAETAAKTISDIQNVDEDDATDQLSNLQGQDGDENEILRKDALDKLEKASGDTLLSQGLKVIDDSVENFASGAWKALGSAWKGGSDFIQKLEHSVAESIEHGGTTGSGAPSLLEAGKAMTFKGIQVLENVGKETMDLLISETGMEVDKKSDGADHKVDEDQLHEEVSFDRCFYIYGGPEQLEELEALSSHYTLLFNRKKAKLSPEQKSFYEGKVKQVQQILDLSTEIDGIVAETDKGKKIETGADASDVEIKSLVDASVSKAADMAAGFTNGLTGLAANEIVQRTTGRLESIHSEGVHRLSEVGCFAASQLLMLAKSMISVNKSEEENVVKMNWPEDCVEKARIIRSKAELMTEKLETVSNSFITGISDVAGCYVAAMKEGRPEWEKSIKEKAGTLCEHLRVDKRMAMSKVEDGVEYMCFILVAASMAGS